MLGNTRVQWMLAVLTVIFMTGTPALAQERGGAGQLRGRVLEVGGGPLPGAAVELRAGERVVWMGTTDRAGRFVIAAPVPGRSVVVLIDGVPQSTLRNVSRDFTTIDPAMIERVEVLRGATANYGEGATGGVINVITRSPGVGAPSFRTEVGMTSSLRAPGEGVGGSLAQSVSGQVGALDYLVSGSFAQTGGFYDAEGDLIPPDPHGQGGLADTRSYDVFGKFGFTRGDRRVQLSAYNTRSDQDTEYTADPAVNALPAGAAKARALPGLVEDDRQGTRNLVLSLDYSDRDVLGSSYEWGGRLEVETPLGLAEGSLLWGADYTFEHTSQPIGVMDTALYDQSGGLVFRKIGERIRVPPLKPHNLGLFAQLGRNVTDRLLVRGGVRHERIGMQVDDFVTVDDNQIYGGDVSYDPTLFNVGAVFDATESLNVYGNFAQGFSLADVGRILRGAGDGFRVGNNTLEAPKVDHEYFDIVSQLDRSDGNAYITAARGAMLTVAYAVTY